MIKGGVLISGYVLRTSLSSCDHAYSVLIKGDVLNSEVYTQFCTLLYVSLIQ